MKNRHIYTLLLCFFAIFTIESPSFSQENGDLVEQIEKAAETYSNSEEAKEDIEKVQKKFTDLPNGLVSAAKFAAGNDMLSPVISPNGKHIVYRQQLAETGFIKISNIKNDKVIWEKNITARWYKWASDRYLVMGTSAFLAGELIMVYDMVEGKLKPIGPEIGLLRGNIVLFTDPKGHYLLIASSEKITKTPAVFHVTLTDNKITKIVKSQKNITSWYADKKGIVRVGLAYTDGKLRIYYRRSNEQKFWLIDKLSPKSERDKSREAIIAFEDIVADSDYGYALSNQETGRFALYRFNYYTGQTGELVYGDPTYDITGYRLNEAGTKLMGVSITRDRDRMIWFDPALKKIQSDLEKALPGQEVWLNSADADGNNRIIFTTASTDPGSHYIYNERENSLNRIGGVNDFIEPVKMSESQYVHYTARDGLKIYAYLTIPIDRQTEKLPMIIMPHGGPYGVRDNGDYDPQVQFLVNRGYVVFQPNFRGSDSYGEDFYEQGVGQIGRKMQDDLDDGMDWLVGRNIVDPNRVCIIGASYGGYAALWGAIRNPERYRCAASFAGVTEFDKQLKYDKSTALSRHARAWKKIVKGERGFDLDTVSPAQNIQRLSRPILLAHGDNDSVVPFEQYEIMVEAAKKANIAIETHVYKGEGHGLSEEENRLDWYNRLEAFLTKHNPAD